MSINAANARAIALDLVIAQGIHSDAGEVGPVWYSNDEYGFFANTSPEMAKLPLTGYYLPHRPELGRPIAANLYLDTAYNGFDIATYEDWAIQDIADCFRTIRHRISGLQNDDQAAAMIVLALKTSTNSVLKYLLPYLQPYIHDELPAEPHDGNEPALAQAMQNLGMFTVSGQTALRHRKSEALLFFGRGVINQLDIQSEAYNYADAWD